MTDRHSLSRADHAREAHEHTCRRTPDVSLTIRQRIVAAHAAFVHRGFEMMVVDVRQKIEWHFKTLFDFGWVRPVFDGWFDPAHDRRDEITGAGGVLRNRSEDLDSARVYTRFFCRLAQRCVNVIAISFLDSPTGKTDLSGVISQVRGTLREQHSRAFGLIDHEYQYGSRFERFSRVKLDCRIAIIAESAVAARVHVVTVRQARGQRITVDASSKCGAVRRTIIKHHPIIIAA